MAVSMLALTSGATVRVTSRNMECPTPPCGSKTTQLGSEKQNYSRMK